MKLSTYHTSTYHRPLNYIRLVLIFTVKSACFHQISTYIDRTCGKQTIKQQVVIQPLHLHRINFCGDTLLFLSKCIVQIKVPWDLKKIVAICAKRKKLKLKRKYSPKQMQACANKRVRKLFANKILMVPRCIRF